MIPEKFVRHVDEIGRIVIPAEMRSVMGWDKNAMLYIYKEGNSIVIKPYKKSCTFCGSEDKIKPFHNMAICAGCIEALKN